MLIKRIVPSFIKLYILEHRYFFQSKIKCLKSQLKKELNNNTEFSIDDKRKWLSKWCKSIYSDLGVYDTAEMFMKTKISILKECEISKSDLILICVEKNDIVKIKKFITHYRNIGIKKFVFLDNNSIDGTKDYLKKQKDVILLETKEEYSSKKRIAWINRIIAHYGDDRWYVVVDSDEFLVYDNFENIKIDKVVEYCKNKKYKRARALLLDMYATSNYYLNGNKEKFIEECNYFDKDSYFNKKNIKFINISGGPRERLFESNACLTKYPLFYFDKKSIFINSHLMYPYKENLNKECILILMHYKFLPGEIANYKQIALKENYYNKSEEYKKYLKYIESNDIDFMYDGSIKYVNSKSLGIINVYDEISW